MGKSTGHEILAHTADVGLRAWAPDLPTLFEQAAAVLRELMADVPPTGGQLAAQVVELDARDLPGLAFAWLNELLGLAEIDRGVPADVRVDSIGQHDDGWRLRAEVRLVPYGEGMARPRIGIKSATYHQLAVERRSGGGWHLTAYLDV
jgi:SHS2 domain-containing protein